MTDRRRQFFTELAALMERHGVTMEVREDCRDFLGCTADGIDFDFDWRYKEGVCEDEGQTVTWTGNYFNHEVVARLIEDGE